LFPGNLFFSPPEARGGGENRKDPGNKRTRKWLYFTAVQKLEMAQIIIIYRLWPA